MVTLRPTYKVLTIPKRDQSPTEFEVHAYLYSGLKRLGLDVRGEIQFKDSNTRRLYRFDLVIYADGVAVEILEVKAHQIKHRHGVENTRQAKRYLQFGVPVTFVYGMEDARVILGREGG